VLRVFSTEIDTRAYATSDRYQRLQPSVVMHPATPRQSCSSKPCWCRLESSLNF